MRVAVVWWGLVVSCSYPQLEGNACRRSGLHCPADQTCAASQAICIPIDSCGDGILNLGEVCDDGNRIDGDGCNATCTSIEVCGNGIVDLGESCDIANVFPQPPHDTADCNSDCQLTTCGDGYVNHTAGEQCDDGFGDSALCNGDCTIARCGDGYVNTEAGEQCDDGPNNSDTVAGACRTNCKR